MKLPKDQKPSIQEQKRQLIKQIDKMDLAKFSDHLVKLKEYRKLMAPHANEAADDLYISTVMNAAIKSDRKEYQKDVDRYACIRGGKDRGKQKASEADIIRLWLYPLLKECEAALPPERVNRGWKTLQLAAISKITSGKPNDPRKGLLTRSRIQAWIDQGRPGKLTPSTQSN